MLRLATLCLYLMVSNTSCKLRHAIEISIEILCRGLVLRTCWSHTPTKRPTAGEIVELFYNNPRIVSPSIDVPLASIQAERSDSIELLPKIKNNQTGLKINLKNSQESLIEGRSDIHLQGGDEEEWSTFLGPYNGGANMSGYVVLDHTATSL